MEVCTKALVILVILIQVFVNLSVFVLLKCIKDELKRLLDDDNK